MALHWNVREIPEQRTSPLGADLADGGISSDNMCHLCIEQVRRVQRHPRASQLRLYRIRSRQAQKASSL